MLLSASACAGHLMKFFKAMRSVRVILHLCAFWIVFILTPRDILTGPVDINHGFAR